MAVGATVQLGQRWSLRGQVETFAGGEQGVQGSFGCALWVVICQATRDRKALLKLRGQYSF
jgi:hypothetical protein